MTRAARAEPSGPAGDGLRRPASSARRCVLFALAAVLALCAAVSPAAGKSDQRPGLVVRYPSGQVPDANALNGALQDPTVGTIVFERGANPFSATLNLFGRSHLTICGATGRPEDTVIDSAAIVALVLDECSDITFRDITIRSTAAGGEAVRLQAVRSSSVEGFVHDVTFRDCRLEAFVPLRGTVRARNLDVADCRIDVTRAGGAGILWEDGPGLFVTRTRFTTSAPSPATGAVVVRGAFVPESEGDRVQRLVLTRNRVDGDFITGFDLADLTDVRIARNRITFPTPTYPTATGVRGRAGIWIRRASAAALTEDFEIRSNVVRGAHTAIWALNTGAGVVARNDLRRSGAAGAADERFLDTGAAVRIGLFGPACSVEVDGNDLRDLRSDASLPAVIVDPAQSAGGCFPEGSKNRTDRGRAVFEEIPKR